MRRWKGNGKQVVKGVSNWKDIEKIKQFFGNMKRSNIEVPNPMECAVVAPYNILITLHCTLHAP